jgi:hypothetical protein
MGYERGNHHDADKFITAVMKLTASLEIKILFCRSFATLSTLLLRTHNFDERSYLENDCTRGLTRLT